MGYIPRVGAVVVALNDECINHVIGISSMIVGQSYIVIEVIEGGNSTTKALRLMAPDGKLFRTLFQIKPASFDHMFVPLFHARARKK